MECVKDTRLLYFGEIHEKINVFNLVIETFWDCDVKLKIRKHGLSVFMGETEMELPFKS